MKHRRLAICMSKGGTGKSTTAISLAAGLAAAGSRVLLVDTDTQGQAGPMLGLQTEQGLAELITGEAAAEDLILPARERLWLLPGGRSMAGLKRLISRKDYGAERTLAEALEPLEDGYDFVLLDTAPGWDPVAVNVLFYAQEVLAPVSLEVLTVQGLRDFSERLTDIQTYNSGLVLRYVLPTFLDGRVKKSQEILQQLEAYYTDRLCAPIRYSVRLSEAPGYGQTIYEYAPSSTGARDYQQLSERILHDGRP